MIKIILDYLLVAAAVPFMIIGGIVAFIFLSFVVGWDWTLDKMTLWARKS